MHVAPRKLSHGEHCMLVITCMHERGGMQVGLLTEETSNTPAAVEYLLSLVPFDGMDARIGGPDAATVHESQPTAAAATTAALAGANAAAPAVSAAELHARHYGIYPVTLELVNQSLQVRADDF